VGSVKSQRPYSSPLRERQAANTRRAVIDAATELFLVQGYGATTIEQIAVRAGVSKPTVFSAVGNKQTLLRVVRDVAIAGDDEAIPVARRPMADRIRDEPHQRRAARLIAQHLTEVASRYAVIDQVIHAAANSGEQEIREVWEETEQQKLIGARIQIRVLADKGPLRPGLDRDTAVDTMWLLMSPDNFYRLVHGRGWTKAKYQRWLGDTIERLLLPPP
jgi:AcrR family transcriptional regulator